MIRVTKALMRKWAAVLLHTHDTPRRTAAAFALGILFGFSPLLGLHTVLALGFAFALGLNRLAVVAGVYANLPWFIAPYYTLATMLGARLLGVPMPHDFAGRLSALVEGSFLSREFWTGLGRLLEPLLVPFAVGATLGAVVLAALAYWLSVPAIEAGRKHLHLPHRHVHPEERP